MTKIKNANYYKKIIPITDGNSIEEGIEIIFERSDKTIYKRKYGIVKSPFDIKYISDKIEKMFVLDIIKIYKIFVSDTMPNIKAETMEEFAKKFIPSLLNK